MKKQKGFTLIELLVVIAIIGILAAVILVNLGSTRAKAKDAAIQLNMSQLRTAAESFYATSLTYTGMCAAGTDCATLEANIVTNGGTTKVENISASAYCIQYNLNATGEKWCIDSAGSSGKTNVSCDAVNYNCP